MHDVIIHAPRPYGHGVFWAVNTEWKKAALFGLAFITLVVATLLPWVLWETKNQERSFAAAVAALDSARYHPPLDRLEGELRAEAGQYHWRMVVWEQVDDEWHASIYSAHVDRHADYAIVESNLTPYPEARDHGHRPPTAATAAPEASSHPSPPPPPTAAR